MAKLIAAFVAITSVAHAQMPDDAGSFLARVGLFSQPLYDQVVDATDGTGWLLDFSQESLPFVQKDLDNVFRAMPKNGNGNLDPVTVRYAMHRYFVEKNGWFVHGVDPAGAHFNSSSPISVLRDHVPSNVVAIFEQRLLHEGYDLMDLATLVAAVENLIMRNSHSKLKALSEMWGVQVAANTTATSAEVDKIIASYMATHILGQNISTLRRRELLHQNRLIRDVYPAWPLLLRHMRSVRERVQGDADALMTWKQVQLVLEEVESTWNREVNNQQCSIIKGHLLDLDDRGTGCVSLSSFYDAKVKKGVWQFSESPQYMRESGLLDESDPAAPKVIMANYINSPGNCVSDMGPFSICCLNECQKRLALFEQHLQSPQATPAEIIAAAALLHSDDLSTSYEVPPILAHRLEDIATQHGGNIILHGRLFAQWLHHAYPRQCPFPHVAGSTTHMNVWNYEERTGKPLIVSEDEAYSLSAGVRPVVADGANGTCAPWTKQEELFVDPARAYEMNMREAEKAVWKGFCVVAMLSAVASMALVIVHTSRHLTKVSRAKRTPPKVLSQKAIMV